MGKSSLPDTTSDERLSEEEARLEAQLEETEPGPRQDLLRRKLQEIETASRAERWLASKDLQPPK